MKPKLFITRCVCIALLLLSVADVYSQKVSELIAAGDKFYTAKKYREAIDQYTKALKLDPQSGEAYFSRGDSYLKKSQADTAFKMAVLDSAVSDFTNAIKAEKDPVSIFSLHIYKANALLLKGAVDPTISEYETAIGLAPSDSLKSAAYSIRAGYFTKIKRYEDAVRDYTAAIQLVKNKAVLYNLRAQVNFYNKQLDAAINDISNAILYDPKNANFYNTRGIIYNSLGNYEEAVHDFMHNLIVNADRSKAFYNIISPLARMQRFNDAAFYYSLNKANEPYSFINDKEYKHYKYFIKAVLQVADNKLPEALKLLDTASQVYGSGLKEESRRGYMDILYLRGYIQEKLKNYDDARVNYEQSLSIDPLQPDVAAALRGLADKEVVFRTMDHTPPMIRIDYTTPPVDTADQRSFGIEKDERKMKVMGSAKDESGIKSVTINGQPVNLLEEDGGFMASIPMKSGSNLLKIVATDKQDNSDSLTWNSDPAERKAEQSAAPVAKGKYYAILIAEEDYNDTTIAKLQYPVRDARQLRNTLTTRYTFDPERVDTLFNRSREDIVETIIARCKSLGSNDNLLIFYAGHGDTTHNKLDSVEGYLVPVTARKGKTSYYISPENIYKALDNSHGKHILVILDACYSGTFTRNAKDSVVSGGVDVQQKIVSRKIMTSGSVEAVPDKSRFIRYLTDILEENKLPVLSTKDIWNFVSTGVSVSKTTNPQYVAFKDLGDRGGTFVFELRKTE